MVKQERSVHTGKQPYFGVDTKEVVLLKDLARTLRDWRDEENDVSLEVVMEALEAYEKYSRQKRRSN